MNCFSENTYRGKRVDNNEWVYGSLVDNLFFGEEGNVPYILQPGEDCDCWNDLREGIDFFEVDPQTVGQYIGLKDHNGTPIFRGDVVVDQTNGIQGTVVSASECDNCDFDGGFCGFLVHDVYNGPQDYNGLWECVTVVGPMFDKNE